MEKYTFKYELEIISGKTVGTDNNQCVDLIIRQNENDNNTGAWELNLANVQVECGKNATDFEHRSYGEELALCQRYYEENKNGQYTATGYHISFIRSGMQFQVQKRATPDVILTNVANSAGTALSLTVSANTMGFNYSMNSASTSYGVKFNYTADAEL